MNAKARTRPDWPALMVGKVAAEYLGMSRGSFDRQVRHGQIPYVLPGDLRWRMFRRTDLDAFLRSLSAQTVAA